MRFFCSCILSLLASLDLFAQEQFLFIGTYTNNGSKGIYVYKFNSATGEVKWLSNTDSISNPSYLAVSSNGNYVYSVSETSPGFVTSFSFDKTTFPFPLSATSS